MNPYETVFEVPLSIYNSKNYNSFKRDIIPFIRNWNSNLIKYKESIVDRMKIHFDIPVDTSLRMGINAIIKDNLKDNTPVLNESDSSFLGVMETLSFDDAEAVNQISNGALGV